MQLARKGPQPTDLHQYYVTIREKGKVGGAERLIQTDGLRLFCAEPHDNSLIGKDLNHFRVGIVLPIELWGMRVMD